MMLRKLALRSPEKDRTAPSRITPVSFETQLQLWFDGVSESDVQRLDEFLQRHYPLKQEGDKRSEARQKGISWTEYANKSLCRWHGEGNLGLVYSQAREEMEGELQNLREVLYLPLITDGDEHNPIEHARRMNEMLRKIADREGKRKYLDLLQSYIEDSSSVVVVVSSDLKNLSHSIENWSAPKDYGDPPFTPALMKLDFLPLREDVLPSLVGVLVGQGMEYETPRHEEVLQRILRREINGYTYTGHALWESKTEKRKES